MIDDRTPNEGRLDLRVLDAGADDARREALIRAVANRLADVPRAAADELTRLLRVRRRLLAVAAVLAGVAAATVLANPRRSPAVPADPISTWAQTSHVPTNGELLAVFQGYAP
jgi:alpha-D-ribose 1-methylphosphonate 5-phosphate C-P lyase